MLTVDRQIRELRAELEGCALTHRERTQALLELNALMARQTQMAAALAIRASERAAPD
ncbi:hypothetical protein SAMN02982917_1778 [Azospirillum oryzae]|uniref:Uncharacterized protein n=1 Tax=Azospirillum oryzae TaxID=286727 RepID=A0A1X7EK36_9PROT|nr:MULTISPECIES: hypothetical protein [Azospirillum]SMF35253.1 hypothetical protein SAMN02982917_1778 [Azospirillum oryzae]